jgi:hypothetical protein
MGLSSLSGLGLARAISSSKPILPAPTPSHRGKLASPAASLLRQPALKPRHLQASGIPCHRGNTALLRLAAPESAPSDQSRPILQTLQAILQCPAIHACHRPAARDRGPALQGWLQPAGSRGDHDPCNKRRGACKRGRGAWDPRRIARGWRGSPQALEP